MIELRDMIESDIEDYVRWFTTETGWAYWDAPWEPLDPTTPEAERAGWTEYYQQVRTLSEHVTRVKFEVTLDGRHIGWVSRYDDLGYWDDPEKLPAVGIDLPEPSARNRGAGTEALRLFIEYLKGRGYPAVYTQTWSGNLPMLRVAEKLGFREVCRLTGAREVNGRRYDAVTFRLDF